MSNKSHGVGLFAGLMLFIIACNTCGLSDKLTRIERTIKQSNAQAAERERR